MKFQTSCWYINLTDFYFFYRDNKYFNEIIDEIKRQIKKEGTVKERREILFSKLNLPTDEM